MFGGVRLLVVGYQDGYQKTMRFAAYLLALADTVMCSKTHQNATRQSCDFVPTTV